MVQSTLFLQGLAVAPWLIFRLKLHQKLLQLSLRCAREPACWWLIHRKLKVRGKGTKSYRDLSVRNLGIITVMGPVTRRSFMLYANSKDADQPAHPCSLISAFVVRCPDSWAGPFEYHLVANPEDRFSREMARMFIVFFSLSGSVEKWMRELFLKSCRRNWWKAPTWETQNQLWKQRLKCDILPDNSGGDNFIFMIFVSVSVLGLKLYKHQTRMYQGFSSLERKETKTIKWSGRTDKWF